MGETDEASTCGSWRVYVVENEPSVRSSTELYVGVGQLLFLSLIVIKTLTII